jgi:hypothetical protein
MKLDGLSVPKGYAILNLKMSKLAGLSVPKEYAVSNLNMSKLIFQVQ